MLDALISYFHTRLLKLKTNFYSLRKTIVIFLSLFLFNAYGQEEANTAISNFVKADSSTINESNPLSDSTFLNFSNSISELALPSSSDFIQKPQRDTVAKKKWRPQVSGTFDLGYEYGLLTGYIDPESTNPLSVFNTRGDFSAEAFNLPFQLSYHYSTMRNPLGVNNYFRVSLDTERLKQIAHERKNKALGGLDDSMNELESQKENVSSKLGMGEVLMQKYKAELESEKEKMSSYANQLNSYQENNTCKARVLIRRKLVSNASSVAQSRVKDSLQNEFSQAQGRYQKAFGLYDTISKLYDKALSIYSMYSEIQQQVEDKKQLVDGYKSKYNEDYLESAAGEKKESFLQSVKTFDIGLTYPKTSALSKNSVPVQGVNFELQRNNWYAAICSGVTMNNLMVSTDVVQNKLNNTQNLFNQFDFQNIQERGLLTTLKMGYGSPEKRTTSLVSGT